MTEAQLQLQNALTTTFLANLAFLSEYDNELYHRVDELSRMIENGIYKEKYHLEFIMEDGDFDIYDVVNEKYLYGRKPKRTNDELVRNANPINYDFTNRPRRQDFDGLFMENGAFYINTIFNIKKDRNRLTGKIAIHEMEEFTAVEIDEEDDWLIAEKMMYKYILSKRKKEYQIKLFLSDVDGTLTDAGMYYGENGEEFKKFNTHDGKGFELLRKAGIKTGIITSENTKIVANRAKKLKVDYLYQGLEYKGKLEIAKEICKELNISLDEVAYIGDDINCKELLSSVGLAACPTNSLDEIKNIPNIIKLSKSGGDGAVREFIEIIYKKEYTQNEKS